MFARHPSMRANFEKLQLPSKELLDCTKEDFRNLGFSVGHTRALTGEILGASASFRLHSFLPSSSPRILLFLILRHPSYSFLECRRRGAMGRLGRCFGSGGAATTPGAALGPGGCHPRGRPGLSRARLAHPNLRRAAGRRGWGKREAERRGPKDRSLLQLFWETQGLPNGTEGA